MRSGRWASLVLALALEAASGGEAPPFHPDAGEVDSAAHAAVRALLADDMPALRLAFDRLERSCPRRMPEERAHYGESMVNADRVYHTSLSAAREHSGGGESQAAFEDFVGILDVCRGCHLLARREGRWPAARSDAGAGE
jgi:hypothetical protein